MECGKNNGFKLVVGGSLENMEVCINTPADWDKAVRTLRKSIRKLQSDTTREIALRELRRLNRVMKAIIAHDDPHLWVKLKGIQFDLLGPVINWNDVFVDGRIIAAMVKVYGEKVTVAYDAPSRTYLIFGEGS